MALYAGEAVIPVDAIDLQDTAFVVTFGRPSSSLAAAIRQAGLVNPPVLAPAAEENKYRVVCGYLRVQALRELGAAMLAARVAEPNTPEADLLELSLQDNLGHRQFNPVEQAGAAARLVKHVPEDEIASRWLPLLGLPPTMKALDACLRIDSLEHGLKLAIVRGEVSAHSAAELALLPAADRLALFRLFASVHLSSSKQAEIIETCADLARRDRCTIAAVLEAPELAAVLADPGPNLSQKGEAVRSLLRRRRFPRLVQRQEQFSALVKKLARAGGVRLSPPPNFEGDTCRIEIAFSKQETLKEAAKTLQALSEDERLRGLLEDVQ